MDVTPDDVIADLDDTLALGFDALLAWLDRVGVQLAAGMLDGQVRPGAELRAARAAIVDHLRDEVIPGITAHRAIAIVDALARHGIGDLEDARPGLERARRAASRPPPPPAWPELAALRALPPDQAQLAPGITHAGFAVELADRGAPVPDELLALYAAIDGLVLRNPQADEVVFRLVPASELALVERDGRVALRIAAWDDRAIGHARASTELWLEDGALTGAFERRHPGQPLARVRFATRPLDVRAMLRFAVARVEAQATDPRERDLGVVAALHAERGWPWYLADDDGRFELLHAAGRTDAARAWCAEMIARLDDDAASCTRAGDHGAASKAERQRERWAARVRDLG